MPKSEGPGRGDSEALSEAEIDAFRGQVLEHYRESGRDFPWRRTRDPWAILVSEIMLQQTQTDRVVPKYLAWMKAYPGPAALASAPLAEVLGLWSGLGYNRRALALARAASSIASIDGFPDDEDSLLELPGVGPYTARAVLAFAFDRPVVLIETNIRSVFLHRFFEGQEGVSDALLTPLIEASMDRSDPRTWYYALMDYGAMLKKTLGNPNSRSAHYAKQSPFADSNRRIRGALLREIGSMGGADAEELASTLPFARERVDKALAELQAEGFVAESCGIYRLGN
jgi:A/G-specific adenine glycosylase